MRDYVSQPFYFFNFLRSNVDVCARARILILTKLFNRALFTLRHLQWWLELLLQLLVFFSYIRIL